MSVLSHAPNSIPTLLTSIDLTIAGPLDALSVLDVRHLSAEAAADGPIVVLLNVADVTAVGASGVVGLLEVLHVLRARGGDLRLFGTSSALDQTLLQAHLGQVARIYATRQEALDGGTNLVGARHLAPQSRWRGLFARPRRTLGWG
ncbi:STAS domain-containing protein [Paenarthrobacter sp. OM7]|uniref:STAS domain-containing protein n=1 Tax=Paenarthrobacter sp. AMU7 TaxID=3162492 RepID=A0AB39YTJ3_9MICC|nr:MULTISPECIES: STAS domain-containing protein [Micrococcaceae]QSZ47715.1 sulfate transporter [Arthrobacter sp. D5-1]WGM21380.1 STAS domain-containing protein [Paenarthrobacter sp. OM7]